MDIILSATEAVRRFSEVLNGVRYEGSRFKIMRNGKPVAMISPIERVSTTRTLGELRVIWQSIPRLGAEASAFETDLEAIIKSQPEVSETDKWALS